MMRFFDGHNDVLSRLWRAGDDVVARFETDTGHINAQACKSGRLVGGFFAIYCPEKRAPSGDVFQEDGLLSEPLPDPLDPDWALRATQSQVGVAMALQRAGHIQIATDANSLRDAIQADAVACILHLEGAEGIDEDLLALDALYAAGLRSLGPVWSRPNAFGHGVPFAHKRTGDTGPGLTDAGKRLVRKCVDLGIVLDCSHITERGFWNIADLGQPIVATHSNAWSLCQSSRNLTDEQLSAIAQSGGIVGLNFEPAFLSETGWQTGIATLEDCMRQLEVLMSALGEDHVALGSDFDGARTPSGIRNAADLPVLAQAMQNAGFGNDVIDKICHQNWIRFLTAHLENQPQHAVHKQEKNVRDMS